MCHGVLTHRCLVVYICLVTVVIIGSDNGLLPVLRLAIISAHAEFLWIGPKGTYTHDIYFTI